MKFTSTWCRIGDKIVYTKRISHFYTLVFLALLSPIRVHSHAPSIRSHSGFSRFPASESLGRTGLHLSLSKKSSSYLPAFEISLSCRTASIISDAGWSKLDFAERNKCKPVLLRLSDLIGWKSGKTTYVPLWERMEGAWLWTRTDIQCTLESA